MLQAICCRIIQQIYVRALACFFTVMAICMCRSYSDKNLTELGSARQRPVWIQFMQARFGFWGIRLDGLWVRLFVEKNLIWWRKKKSRYCGLHAAVISSPAPDQAEPKGAIQTWRGCLPQACLGSDQATNHHHSGVYQTTEKQQCFNPSVKRRKLSTDCQGKLQWPSFSVYCLFKVHWNQPLTTH